MSPKDNLRGGRRPQEAELQTRGHRHLSRAAGTGSPVVPVDAASVPMEVGAWGLEALGTAEAFPRPPNFQQQSQR